MQLKRKKFFFFVANTAVSPGQEVISAHIGLQAGKLFGGDNCSSGHEVRKAATSSEAEFMNVQVR